LPVILRDSLTVVIQIPEVSHGRGVACGGGPLKPQPGLPVSGYTVVHDAS
jgi:hypothetical protein